MSLAGGAGDAEAFVTATIAGHEMATTPMTPDVIGPYRIVSVLGQGGMGIVYHAVHMATGARAALKTVPAPSASHVKHLRREIQALARIRHPGIVSILDEGVFQGVPWYAMELVDGVSLRHGFLSGRDRGEPSTTPDRHLDPATSPITTAPLLDPPLDAARLREPFRSPASGRLLDALEIVEALCGPLAYLHGEGIVHRDLKPDNILVRPGGEPVIVDFGLTRLLGGSFGRELLDVEPELAGTIHYMSPEQAQGKDVDARADLYALGCILYELLTGRPPFVGRWSEVLRAHAFERPAPPSALVGPVPEDLDRLVLHLLAKSPRDRLGYADDLARGLSAVMGRGRRSGVETSRTYLYRPGFVGRTGALAVLGGHLEALAEGTGGAVLVVGEAGSGKTRLVLQAIATCSPGLRVLSGECLPRAAASDASRRALGPFVGILLALADHCREAGLEEAERIFGDRAAVLSPYQPSLADLLPGVPAPADLPLGEARHRVFRALGDTLRGVARRASLLLVLDDLHWADELTLAFLPYFMRELQERPAAILLLMTCRTEESVPELDALRTSCRILPLPPLDRHEVSAMAADMLALDPCPAELSDLLARRCGGNPFFVAEHLRAAVSEAILTRDPERGWTVRGAADVVRMEVPPSIRAVVARRIAGLEVASRELIHAASVFREEFDEDSLCALLPDGASVHASLGALTVGQVLEERGAGTYRFVHDELRRAAYEAMTPERRAELHRAAAAWLEKRQPSDPAAVGHHWEEGGVPDRARACYLTAARLARDAYALEDAERLYGRYLGLAQDATPDRVRALLGLGGGVLAHVGRSREADEILGRALQESRALGDRLLEAQSCNLLAQVRRRRGTLPEVRDLYTRALEISRERGDRESELVSLSNLALAHFNGGELLEARELWEAVLAGVREAGDRGRESVVLSNLAGLHLHEGRRDLATEMFERAVGIARETGARLLEGVFVGNLAIALLELGRLVESRPLFEEALARHRELGNLGSEGQLLKNYAKLHEEEGRFEEAESLFRRALDILERIEDHGGRSTALTMLGEFFQGRGRRAESIECFREAVDLARRAGHREAEQKAAQALEAAGNGESA